MSNSFIIPIKTNLEFVQARIFDLKRDIDYQLMISDTSIQTFNNYFPTVCRKIIVYVRRERQTLSNSFLRFVKVEVEKKDDLVCVLKGLKIIFPRSNIFVSTPKTEYRKLKNFFKNFVFLAEEECFL